MLETEHKALFDYAALPEDVRDMVQEHTGEIRNLAHRALHDIMEIGGRLLEVKAALAHGEFRAWLEAEFQWSHQTAHRFMQVAEAFKSLTVRHLEGEDNDQFKMANFADLDIAPSALYALASGSTPEAIREEFVQRAQAGEPVTRKAVAERLEQHQQQFEPEPAPPAAPPSPPPAEAPRQPAPQPAPQSQPPAPVSTPVKATPPTPPLAKREYTPLPREVEDLELADGSVVKVPSLPMLPREKELKQRDFEKAAARFDSAASRVLAALTALDVYSMDEVREIAQSPEGRQLFAPVRVQRIQEMLEQLHSKWVSPKLDDRIIDASPLIEVLPPKKDDERTLETLN